LDLYRTLFYMILYILFILHILSILSGSYLHADVELAEEIALQNFLQSPKSLYDAMSLYLCDLCIAF